jgi:hypothetical protein
VKLSLEKFKNIPIISLKPQRCQAGEEKKERHGSRIPAEKLQPKTLGHKLQVGWGLGNQMGPFSKEILTTI